MFNDRFIYILHTNKSKIKLINPFIKIISFILFIASLIITNNIYISLLLFIFSLLLLYKTNIKKTIDFKYIKMLLIIFIFVFVLALFSSNILFSLIIVFKFITFIIYLYYLMFTLTLKDLYLNLIKILKPLKKINIKIEKICLFIIKQIYLYILFIKELPKVKETLIIKINQNLNLIDKLIIIKMSIKSIFLKSKQKYKIITDYLLINSFDVNKLKDKKEYNYILNIMFLLIHVIILVMVIACEVLV